MKYDGSYIYPCRPANAIPPDDLNSFDDNTMTAQLKINGSNTIILTNGKDFKVMGRHKQILSNFQISKDEIIETMYSPLKINGNWLVINGETLNKSKLDENNNIFNQKFIIFDLLVFDSDYLVGKTFQERISLLDDMYGQIDSDKEYLYGVSENIYRVKSHDSDFKNIFDKYTNIPFIEGLVLKRKNAKLEVSSGEKNNWRSQVKCRKPEKNYKF